MKNLKSTKSRVILSLAVLIVLFGLIPILGIFNGGKQPAHADSSGWTRVPSPNPNNPLVNNSLSSVSATSSSDAWAVGGSQVNQDFQQMIMHWDGSQWSLNNFPDNADQASYLFCIAAVSPNDVWAVGYGNTTSNPYIHGSHPLVEHYLNGVWSIVVTPSLNGSLWGVTAVSSSNVWAVGYDIDTNNELIEHWNGSSWSVIPPPARTTAGALLHSVTVVSATNIWAVGTNNWYGRNGQAIADYWDGTSWTTKDPPGLTDGNGTALYSASAIPSTGVVWAAGITYINGGNSDPQIIGYFANGKWNAITDTVSQGYSYNAVAASASEVDVMTYQSTAEKYISGNWQSVPVEGSLSGSHLWGMNVIPGDNSFWAVGVAWGGSTIVEQYTPSPGPSPTPSPTPQPQRTKLFLLMPGFTSHLSAADAASGVIPADTFGQTNGIEVSLKNKFPGSRFVMFSYNGDDGTGKPTAYSCQDTLTRFMTVNVDRLKIQIIDLMKTYQNIDVYLVGHSYGGAVALALDADMKTNGQISTNGGIVKGIITLDSPLGGVYGGPLGVYYLIAANLYYKPHCPAATGTLYSLNELTQIFLGGPLYGSNNSLMHIVNGGNFSNQQVADAEVGTTSVLAVGNIEDYTYAPRMCPNASLLPKGKFLSTQLVADQSSQMRVFGRIFVGGQSTCPSLTNLAVNHWVVLTNYYVKQGINQFVGNKPITSLAVPAAGFQ